MSGSLLAEMIAADEARYQALYRQDIASLEPMLADDYLHVHAKGKIDDKAAFLATIQAARYRFVDAQRTEQQLRIVGAAVLLCGKTRTTLDVSGATKVMANAFVTVWVPSESRWKLQFWQATPLPDA